MKQEEKAKRYDEAIKVAKFKIKNDKDHVLYEDDIIEIFPELKESEDERIRKCLIDLVNGIDTPRFYGIDRKATIVWLEKQGDIDKTSYEIAEKEKREFVGGGFIKCYADFQDFKERETYWLEYVGNDNYNVRSDNLLGKTYHITPCQLYTIFKKQTWLEKKGETSEVDGTFVNIDDVREDFIQEIYRILDADPTNDRANQIIGVFDGLPTVKFEKRGESNPYSGVSFKYNGHTWGMCARDNGVEILVDGEIKERVFLGSKPQGKSALEAINEEKIDNQNCAKSVDKIVEKYNITGIRSTHAKGKLGEMIKNLKSVNEMKVEPKFNAGDVLNSPSHHLIWIYRDNEHYYACLNMNYVTKNVAIGGLIKIPSDARPATKDERTILFRKLKKFGYEWDKEKKQLKTKVIHKKLTEFEKAVKQVMEKAIECGDTRSLKADAEMLLSLVHKSAWSEEDEKKVNNLYVLLDQMVSFNMLSNKDATEFKDCLKSLKDRVQHQPTWKPSDEQMDAINDAIDYLGGNTKIVRKHLMSLYEQLKKLKAPWKGGIE